MSQTVEEWIAQGNSPKVLPMGYTSYPDGIIPGVKNIKIVEKKPKDLENSVSKQSIRSENKAKRLAEIELKKKQEKLLKEKSIIAQKELLDPFFEKAKKQHISTLIKMTGMSSYRLKSARNSIALSDSDFEKLKSSLDGFDFSIKEKVRKPRVRKPQEPRDKENSIRLGLVREAKEKALLSGDKLFLAPCRKHGMVTYFFDTQGFVKCKECKRDGNRKYHKEIVQTDEKLANHARILKNRELMNLAADAGLKSFEGMCQHHGKTTYLIFKRWEGESKSGATYQSKCRQCGIEKAQAYRKEVKSRV